MAAPLIPFSGTHPNVCAPLCEPGNELLTAGTDDCLNCLDCGSGLTPDNLVLTGKLIASQASTLVTTEKPASNPSRATSALDPSLASSRDSRVKPLPLHTKMSHIDLREQVDSTCNLWGNKRRRTPPEEEQPQNLQSIIVTSEINTPRSSEYTDMSAELGVAPEITPPRIIASLCEETAGGKPDEAKTNRSHFSKHLPPSSRSSSMGMKTNSIESVIDVLPPTSSVPQNLSPNVPLPMAPTGSRPVLNRYYSTPMNLMSPSRQHFRLHNPTPHHVKETPTIRFSEDARGRFINQYQITRVVGRGSFGMVYLAVDPQGQQYALKECSKRRLAKLNRVALMRLRKQILTRGSNAPTEGEISSLITREIAVMKKLDHPNLVTLFEVLDDPTSESLILVLEWCPEGTIMPAEEEYDGKAKPIPETKSRLYFRDLILGVEYLHARGVCHRDIKADNVLLGQDDVVKIADFGVSEIFDLTKNEEDSVQRPVGSLAYMSPELIMLQCGSQVVTTPPASKLSTPPPGPSAPTSTMAPTSPRPHLHPAHAPISGRKADIWAMGVTLYYMVHGRLPFEAPNVAGLHHAILTTEPDLSQCSPELADLFRRIFAKNPAERITLREIRDHPWVTQNGLDALLPLEENVQVSDNDKITEEDLRNAIDQITHRPGAPRLDYFTITRSLRANYGWHGSTTGSECSSGAQTPRQTDPVGGISPPNQAHSPNDSQKMEKLSRALEELLKVQESTYV